MRLKAVTQAIYLVAGLTLGARSKLDRFYVRDGAGSHLVGWGASLRLWRFEFALSWTAEYETAVVSFENVTFSARAWGRPLLFIQATRPPSLAEIRSMGK